MDSTYSAPLILQKVRDALEARGDKTIRSLGRVFRSMDSFDGNKKVDKDEFLIALQQLGVKVTKSEAASLLSYLDTDHDGSLNFQEFLTGVRGQMSPKRQAIVDKAFLKFDRDGNGYISAADMRGVYNASSHPKVQKGQMTEDQVFLEFLENFGDHSKDGTLTRDEWNDYYHSVSASVDNDDHFVQLMKSCWKLD